MCSQLVPKTFSVSFGEGQSDLQTLKWQRTDIWWLMAEENEVLGPESRWGGLFHTRVVSVRSIGHTGVYLSILVSQDDH